MRSLPHTALALARKLKFHQIQVFDRVLETGSLVRAANETGLTQPAVSKIVHELEATFGAPLFLRSNRGMQPTEFGELLGRRVKSMMAELRYLTDEVNAFGSGASGHVIVGTLISASAELLPRTIAQLKARAPGVLVSVREAAMTQLFPALASGDLDIVVGRLPERALPLANAFALAHQVLFRESLCVVGGAKHWARASRRVPLARLREGAWILPVPESPSRLAAERLFHEAGLALPEDVVESLSVLTNIGLMLDSPRVALMPRAAATRFVESGLLRVLADTEPGSFGDVGYSLRADKQPSPACERFIACLREVCERASGGMGA